MTCYNTTHKNMLQHLPEHIIGNILQQCGLWNEAFYHRNDISLLERLCLANKAPLFANVNSQINYLKNEFDFLRTIPRNYWYPAKEEVAFVFMLFRRKGKELQRCASTTAPTRRECARVSRDNLPHLPHFTLASLYAILSEA